MTLVEGSGVHTTEDILSSPASLIISQYIDWRHPLRKRNVFVIVIQATTDTPPLDPSKATGNPSCLSTLQKAAEKICHESPTPSS